MNNATNIEDCRADGTLFMLGLKHLKLCLCQIFILEYVEGKKGASTKLFVLIWLMVTLCSI